MKALEFVDENNFLKVYNELRLKSEMCLILHLFG